MTTRLADLLCPDGWRFTRELSRTLEAVHAPRKFPEPEVISHLKKFSFYEFENRGSLTVYRRRRIPEEL